MVDLLIAAMTAALTSYPVASAVFRAGRRLRAEDQTRAAMRRAFRTRKGWTQCNRLATCETVRPFGFEAPACEDARREAERLGFAIVDA